MEKTLFALSLGFAGLILAVHAAQAAPVQMALYPSHISLIDTNSSAQVTS
jgi:hypothetical protein